MKKITTAQISIGIVCLVLAFTMTMQIKSVRKNRAASNEESLRVQDMMVNLMQEKEKNDTLVAQVIQLKEDIQSFKSDAAESSDYSKTLARQLEKAEILAGMTDVEGGGVIISMRDSRSKDQLFNDPNLSVIHDEDLLRVINELADGGAEAISVNNERIVAISEVRCSGATVSINNNRYAEPYEIKAIGDPANLESAIMMKNGIYDTLTYYGVEMTVKKADNIKINAYTGSNEFKYVKPVVSDQAKGGQQQ